MTESISQVYTALIADVVSSRKIAPGLMIALKLRIDRVIETLNRRFSYDLIANLELSSGDSIQGLFTSSAAAYQCGRLLEIALYPVLIRVGLGEGDWTKVPSGGGKSSDSTETEESVSSQDGKDEGEDELLSNRQEGSSYYAAQASLEKLEAENILGPLISITDDSSTANSSVISDATREQVSNTLARALEDLSCGQLERQREISVLFEVLELWKFWLWDDEDRIEENAIPEGSLLYEFTEEIYAWRKRYFTERAFAEPIEIYAKALPSPLKKRVRTFAKESSATKGNTGSDFYHMNLDEIGASLTNRALAELLGISAQAVSKRKKTSGAARILDIDNAWIRLNNKSLDSDEKKAGVFAHFSGIQRSQKNLTQAVGWVKKSLKIYESLAKKSPETFEPRVAMSHNNLGNLNRNIQHYSEAEDYYVASLKIHERLAEKSPETFEPRVAMSHNNLGILYSDIQRYQEAEEHYVASLKIYERLAEKSPKAFEPDVAMAYNNLGILYSDIQRYQEAKDHYVASLKIRERLTKRNPEVFGPSLVRVLSNLGELFLEQGNCDSALNWYEKALKSCKDMLSLEHPLCNAVYKGLAACYLRMGNSEKAREIISILEHDNDAGRAFLSSLIEREDLLEDRGSA